QQQQYRQVETLFSLFSQLSLNAPLPVMRGYSISPDFATLLLAQIQFKQPRLIVELGSGVSTLISGYALLKQGSGRVISIDQSAEFLDYVAQNLLQHRLEHLVQVLCATLRPVEINGEVWDWYDLKAFDDIENIDFLVIDGPAQFNNMKVQVRYPALPILYDKLAPGAYILLDDANREDEQQIVERWLTEFDIRLIRHYTHETEKGAKLLQKGN
ncbi:MAG: class I SAM-dependent methyltransferase, partial [Anaerolineae bacterium]|nr:class I SAM-dependent methyltransferase [Anaerolineae bacterium]